MRNQCTYMKEMIQDYCKATDEAIKARQEERLFGNMLKGKADRSLLLRIFIKGSNRVDISYANNLTKFCQNRGIPCETYYFDNRGGRVAALPHQEEGEGFLVLNSDNLELSYGDIDKLPPNCKGDIDSFFPESPNFYPITAEGISDFLNYLSYKQEKEFTSQKFLLVGFGKKVNAPLYHLLKGENSCPYVEYVRSTNTQKELIYKSHKADIIITAVGKPGIMVPECINDRNKIIIDCGVHFDKNGKQRGDCSAEVRALTDRCTPIKNGVGAITKAMLQHHLVVS